MWVGLWVCGVGVLQYVGVSMKIISISCSHTQLTLEQELRATGETMRSRLCIADLGGSEQVCVWG